MAVTASANRTEKITICRTSPSAIALMIDVGERWAIISPNDCGWAGGSGAVRLLDVASAAWIAFCMAMAAWSSPWAMAVGWVGADAGNSGAFCMGLVGSF